jgi:hypothetical protein
LLPVHVGAGIEPPVVQLVCFFVSFAGFTPELVELMPLLAELLDVALAAFFVRPFDDGAAVVTDADAVAAGAGVAACSAFFSWPGAVSKPGGGSGGDAKADPVSAASASPDAAHAARCRRIECMFFSS